MNNYLSTPLEFLIETLFGLYILAVMLRFLLQWVRADFYNPISQFLVKVTNPPLRPLRRFIPGLAGIDLASVVLMLVLQMVALSLVFMVRGAIPGVGVLLIVSVAELVSLLLNVFLVTIFIQVILSWVNPGQYNPVTSLLYSLNQPLLGPAQRLIPPIGGIDLSPIVVIIAIQLAKMLILPPLYGLAG
ncbi:MAG: YggT family protein [Gammaproteobacteria bacterium]